MRQCIIQVKARLAVLRLVTDIGTKFGFGTLAQRHYFLFINRLRESASAREKTLMSSSARVSTSAP